MESIKSGNFSFVKEIKHNLDTYEYNAYCLPDGKCVYFASIGYDDPRDEIYFPPYIAFCDGKSSKRFNLYPRLCSNKNEIYDSFYTHTTRYDVESGKLVQTYALLDMFNIIDPSRQTVDCYKQRGSYGLEDVEKLPSLSAAKDFAHIYHLDVAFMPDGFLLLCDGRSFKEMNKYGEGGKYLQKYDWNGNLQAVYTLSDKVLRIAFSASCYSVYGLDTDGRVFRFKLSKNV